MRSWNVFHGNTHPPRRTAYLEEMVRLAAADRPDVLCLQEVPVWAFGRLAGWSGMTAFADVAARPAIGPLPSTAELGRLLTSLHHGLLRSAFSGQGNAILAAPGVGLLERSLLVLNPAGFRRAQARSLRLGPLARLAWAGERRVCQAVRIALPDGRSALVANLHTTSYHPDERLADAELLRAAVFADGLARPDEPLFLCGDFNVTAARSHTLAELAAWSFSAPGPGIDHVLARNVELRRGPEPWPQERRRLNGRVFSDHAPVEVEAE